MIAVCAKHRPLSCRISPAQAGRLAVAARFANFRRCRTGGADELLISLLAGEMAGRPEGGVKDLGLAAVDLIVGAAR
ncbi:hypothetical protein CK215_14135 [Mesorhizobium sp. WSM3864]|nr:hypothetical protein A9K71_12350 [Mesorhizobium sp. WSM3873]PBB92066.1 hypothetical protein CK215_14135 [Mesorhizobium sp. WSM3864]